MFKLNIARILLKDAFCKKNLSRVLPALILFTDVKVRKLVTFCCFCHF